MRNYTSQFRKISVQPQELTFADGLLFGATLDTAGQHDLFAVRPPVARMSAFRQLAALQQPFEETTRQIAEKKIELERE